MSDNQQALIDFAEAIRGDQKMWALTAGNDEDWVVVDSQFNPEDEVFLVWDTQEAAQAACTEEWEIYTPSAIPVQEYLDFWVEELGAEGVLLGLNWLDDQENIEVKMIDLAKVLLDTGVYKDQ
ncbi:DUF2750 domain-containing protein [Catenovulum sp. 2E275]|uniref:DUF2750 domain-containing protein n=1 Tax=Catenovulum sp. 2E275 TaxID=2980497 RepID=UPI0021D11359|nr:DUF2750 domain-containing protein [Catenovulum sp. 2E275]MCU4675116.1 DUF2750 domain-containing protein [Catenovulum sp. 2E275]